MSENQLRLSLLTRNHISSEWLPDVLRVTGAIEERSTSSRARTDNCGSRGRVGISLTSVAQIKFQTEQELTEGRSEQRLGSCNWGAPSIEEGIIQGLGDPLGGRHQGLEFNGIIISGSGTWTKLQ